MTSLVFLGPFWMFLMTLILTLPSRPSVSEKSHLHGSLRPSEKRWTDMIDSSGSIAATHQLEHGTAPRPKGIVLFGFKRKPKWSIFINYYARSHILLTSGTLLLLPQLRLKIGHPLTQITHHPLPTLSTPTSPLSAPPFSTLTILHHQLHLFLTPHPHFLCTQQLLNGVRILLLLSKQTALLGRINYLLLPLLLVVLSSPIHCVLLSTLPLLVLCSWPHGSVPLSSLFTKVETVPHLRTTVLPLFSQFPAKFSRSMFISTFHNIFTPTTYSILFSLDSALPTQPKLFFSTVLTISIRPLTPRSMWVQYSSTFPKPSTLSATSYFYPNSPT